MAKTKTKTTYKKYSVAVDTSRQWIAGGIACIAVGLLLIGAATIEAATDRYQFVARGTVIAVDGTLKTVTVSITHVTGKGEADLKGETQVFKGSSAKIYKTAAGQLKRIKLTNIAIGDELVMKGVAKSDDTFVLTWVHVNTRSFELIGTLKDHDTALKRLTIAVTTSSYKPTTYNKKDVVVKYSGSTKFISNGREVNADEIAKGDHKVKVSGKIVGNEWEVDRFIDNYVAR